MTKLFDTSVLETLPLAQRTHDLDTSVILDLAPIPAEAIHPNLAKVGRRIAAAREAGASVILMMGGHVLRSGVQRHLIDLMERGYISALSMNGAVVIHDYEMALIGATTENVARYIRDGQFGLWQETGRINDIVSQAYRDDPKTGLGEAVGRAIHKDKLPHADTSLLAAAYRTGTPATVHIGIGHDIIHEHPNFDGAASGALSYNDFLRLTQILTKLEGGVVMNFGSAVMAPEVYLKSLAMVRNAARRTGHSISRFCTLVCDLHDLPETYAEEPAKTSAQYYFRPWKTMLVRTVQDGGEGYYVRGRHADTVPALWTVIAQLSEKQGNAHATRQDF